MLQKNKLATAHKSSNYCLRRLLQKQFITQSVSFDHHVNVVPMIVFIQIEGEEKKKEKKNQTLYIFSEPTSLSEHLSLRQPDSPLQLELLLIRFFS